VQIPGIQHVLARVVGMGVLPEHIKGTRKPSGLCMKKIAVGIGIAAAAAVLTVRMLRRSRRGWAAA